MHGSSPDWVLQPDLLQKSPILPRSMHNSNDHNLPFFVIDCIEQQVLSNPQHSIAMFSKCSPTRNTAQPWEFCKPLSGVLQVGHESQSSSGTARHFGKILRYAAYVLVCGRRAQNLIAHATPSASIERMSSSVLCIGATRPAEISCSDATSVSSNSKRACCSCQSSMPISTVSPRPLTVSTVARRSSLHPRATSA